MSTKSAKTILAIAALILAGCSGGLFSPLEIPTRASITATPAGIALPTPAPILAEPTKTPDILPVSAERCVVAETALWLRSEPSETSLPVSALPNGTILAIITPGEWARVYVASIDEYGYVRSAYIGDCDE